MREAARYVVGKIRGLVGETTKHATLMLGEYATVHLSRKKDGEHITRRTVIAIEAQKEKYT